MFTQGAIILGLLAWAGYLGIFWLFDIKHWIFWATLIGITTLILVQLAIYFFAPPA